MKFGAAFWLALLPVVAGGFLALRAWSDRRGRARLRAAFPTPWLVTLLSSVSPARRFAKLALLTLALTGLMLALARPQFGRSQIEIERTGVDLVLALDVSRSMLAPDVEGTNRMTAATAAIHRLLDELGGDRVGLVLFAGQAFVAAPLTRDHAAVERALESASPEAVSEQGSNLGEAIQKARESFDRASQGPRALLVVSDGEQLQGDAIEAARSAASAGIRVHTAGVGSVTGARLPRHAWQTGNFVRNALGREVISRRDEQRLQQIAAVGNGLYTRIDGAESRALAGWFHAASASLARTTEKKTVNEPRERFQWPLAVALLWLGAEWMLGDRKKLRATEPASS